MNGIYTTFRWLYAFEHGKKMLISLYFLQPKYTKMQQQEILFIGRNVLEFFCVPLHADFLSYLHEKFHIVTTYDINVEYKI